MSVLATRDDLLRGVTDDIDAEDCEIDEEECDMLSKGVYPPIFHMYRVKGMYILRFFKDFVWRYVIIDDRIPCYKRNNQPVFGRC